MTQDPALGMRVVDKRGHWPVWRVVAVDFHLNSTDIAWVRLQSEVSGRCRKVNLYEWLLLMKECP